jgi:hypothetical protein
MYSSVFHAGVYLCTSVCVCVRTCGPDLVALVALEPACYYVRTCGPGLVALTLNVYPKLCPKMNLPSLPFFHRGHSFKLSWQEPYKQTKNTWFRCGNFPAIQCLSSASDTISTTELSMLQV